MSIRIDPEFESLIPPLTADEFKQLEENCVAEGIRDPLVVWSTGKPGDDDILVDGHNRWKISANHGGILFTTKRIMFKDRDEVKKWIIQNQFGRRNLSAYDRSVLALKLKPLIQEKAKENQGERTDICQKSDRSSIDTKKELAKAAGVSHDTIHKVEKIEAEASEKTKQAIRNGDISINHAFNNLPSQRNKDIVKEAKRQAQKEHLEYLEEKASGTVSIESAKREKDNARLLSYETKDAITELIKASRTINLIITTDSLRQMLTVISKYERDRMIDDLSSVIRTVVSLQKRITQEGEKNG